MKAEARRYKHNPYLVYNQLETNKSFNKNQKFVNLQNQMKL